MGLRSPSSVFSPKTQGTEREGKVMFPGTLVYLVLGIPFREITAWFMDKYLNFKTSNMKNKSRVLHKYIMQKCHNVYIEEERGHLKAVIKEKIIYLYPSISSPLYKISHLSFIYFPFIYL